MERDVRGRLDGSREVLSANCRLLQISELSEGGEYLREKNKIREKQWILTLIFIKKITQQTDQ
jgi:hypothetical protein